MDYDPVETDDLAAMYAGLWNHQGATPESIDKDELRTVQHELSHGEHGLHWDDEEKEWVVCSPLDDCDDDSLMEATEAKDVSPVSKPVKEKKPLFTGMITDKRGAKRYYENGKQVKGPAKPKPPPKEKAPKVAPVKVPNTESSAPVDEGGLRDQLKQHSHHELNDKEKSSAKRSLSAYKRAHGENVVARLGQVAGQLQKSFDKATDEHVKDELSRKLKGIEHMLDVAKEPAAAKKPRTVKAKVAGKDVKVVSRDPANGLVKVSDGNGERVVSSADLSDVVAEEQGPSEDPRMKARKKQLAMGQSPLPAGFRGEDDEKGDPKVKALTKGSQWGRLRRISVEDKADEALAKKLTAGQFAAKLTSNTDSAETLKNFYRAYRDRKGVAKNAPAGEQPKLSEGSREITPSQVADIVFNSPNNQLSPDQDKEDARKRLIDYFGINGTYEKTKTSVDSLKADLESGKIKSIKPPDQSEVDKKASNGKFNDVLLVADKTGQIYMLDGTHSLLGAIKSGAKNINVIKQAKSPKIFESADPWLDMPEYILDLLGD